MAKYSIRPGSPIDHVIKGGKAIGYGALVGAAGAANTALADVHPNGMPIAGAIAGGLAGLAGHVGYSMGKTDSQARRTTNSPRNAAFNDGHGASRR